jgi:recombination protein RecR
MGGPEIEKLIGLLAKLPGMGPAARDGRHSRCCNSRSTHAAAGVALAEAARAVKPCGLCGNLDSLDPCSICTDPRRDRSLICVVEGVGDLWALERASVFLGLYHVLGGTLSALAGVGPEDLNVSPLLARIAEGNVSEVILALGATVDGAPPRTG